MLAAIALAAVLGACPSIGLSRAAWACEPQPRSEEESDRPDRLRRGSLHPGPRRLRLGPGQDSDTLLAAPPQWEALGGEALAVLQGYLRIRSVNPPADTREAAAYLEEILRKEGIPTERFESAPGKVNLLARLRATSPRAGLKPVLLLHHMDVVPVDPARWPVDPFGGVVKDGFLFGRGAADMKGIGVLHLMALVALKRQGLPLRRDILLLATADEESGGLDGARWMLEHQGGLLGPEYVLDEGGFGSRDMLAADGRLVFGVSVGEKKILWLRVIAAGTAGHASQPIPDNAPARLARAVSEILAAAGGRHGEPGPVIRELERRIGPLADNKFTRAIRADTVSLTTLRAGVGDPPKANVIPSAAEATLDCRLRPQTDPDLFLADVRRAAARIEGVTVEVIYRMDRTPVSSHDTPLFAALESAIHEEHPGATVAPILIPYGTDSNAFRLEGAVSYGLNPMVLDAGIVGSMHSDAERIPVAGIQGALRIFHRALVELCGPETESP